MISQYGHPPSTSLPSVMVSGGHLPPPIQHIHTINNGSHATTLSHIGQVETASYTRHPPQHHGVPPQFGRPPPVLVNRSQQELGSAKTKEKTPMCLVNELARFNKVGITIYTIHIHRYFIPIFVSFLYENTLFLFEMCHLPTKGSI